MKLLVGLLFTRLLVVVFFFPPSTMDWASNGEGIPLWYGYCRVAGST